MTERIQAGWPAPPGVHAFTTTRAGGVSEEGYASLNLGGATEDDPDRVAENRRRFRALLPGPPGWLRQVHGCHVLNRMPGDAAAEGQAPEADGAWTASPRTPCTVLTADCLPVLFCDQDGSKVAVAHAGWRGLAGGVLEATIAALPAEPGALMVWLGPGIGVDAYEVGREFQADFQARLPWLEEGFERIRGEVHANLETIARAILRRAGVGSVHGGGFCTYTDSRRFYSHRRHPASGRMATTIWLED